MKPLIGVLLIILALVILFLGKKLFGESQLEKWGLKPFVTEKYQKFGYKVQEWAIAALFLFIGWRLLTGKM